MDRQTSPSFAFVTRSQVAETHAPGALLQFLF